MTPILAGVAGMAAGAGGGAGGSAPGSGGGAAVRGTVHLVATELPYRLLRDVCTAAACAGGGGGGGGGGGSSSSGSADDAWATLLPRLDKDAAKYKRVLREVLDTLMAALREGARTLMTVAYTVSDDRFDVVH
jgi:hypothetical protein